MTKIKPCKTHPKYKVIRPPRKTKLSPVGCLECWRVFNRGRGRESETRMSKFDPACLEHQRAEAAVKEQIRCRHELDDVVRRAEQAETALAEARRKLDECKSECERLRDWLDRLRKE